MKILNLYACLGGNRYKWGNNHDITAVEWDEELARLYQQRFPKDKVIVADAHQYLLEHYKEFDFIWSSPPCPTHSRARYWGFGKNEKKPIYPDMKLYQEIIFLQSSTFARSALTYKHLVPKDSISSLTFLPFSSCRPQIVIAFAPLAAKSFAVCGPLP